MARVLGKALRETGQALDRLGRSLQGNYAFREEREPAWAGGSGLRGGSVGSAGSRQRALGLHLRPAGSTSWWRPRGHSRRLHVAAAVTAAASRRRRHPPPAAVNRHRSLAPLAGRLPSLGRDAFVAPSAAVVGDVTLGAGASVFYGAVIRGARGVSRGRGQRLRWRGRGRSVRGWRGLPATAAGAQGSSRAAPRPHRLPLRAPHAARCTALPAADSGSVTVGDRTNIQDGCVIRTAPGAPGGHAAGTAIGHSVTVGHQAALHGCTVGDRALIGMNAVLDRCTVRRLAAGCGLLQM